MSFNIYPVFCNEKNMANYAYIVKNENTVVIIDAAETNPIVTCLEQLSLTPDYILTTHHHFDHVGANLELKQKYNLKIVAPEKEFSLVPGADIVATPELELGSLKFEVINAFGHTNGHILYYLKEQNALFTGDVLFNLCVGGLFEGTAEDMFYALQKIKSLPDTTEIYPGHEYTRACVRNIRQDTPQFSAYLQKMLLREQGCSAPATLKEEKTFNPYLQARSVTDFLG